MKPQQSRLVFFTFITLLVLVTNLVLPTSALADDGVPPESTPAEAPPVETPPVDEAPPPEAPVSLPEVLEQAPPDTAVVVVNDAGQVEPLATVEAAEILVTGDPVWCPAAVVGAPTPGANGCTPSYGSMTNLLADLDGDAAYQSAGTIWIESTYDGTADGSSVTIDQAGSYDLSYLTDLTVQGFGATTPTIVVPFSVINWLGNVTLNNLYIDADDTYAALVVDILGDITMDDVTVTANATGTGASLDSCQSSGGLCAGTGNVTVTDSTFNGNNFIGLVTNSGGNTTLTNVTANGNIGPGGAYVTGVDDDGTGDVIVTNSTFSGNVNGTGVDVLSDGNVTLTNVTTDGNNTGALLDTTAGTGAILVDGGQFNGNDYDGLDIWAGGNITVSNTDSSSNLVDGASLDATYGTGNILVSNSTFIENDSWGISAVTGDGSTTLNGVTVDGVDALVPGTNVTDVGAGLASLNGIVSVQNSTFTDTTSTGLLAVGGLQVDLVNVTVNTNAGDGAQVYSVFTYACFGSTGILVNVNGGTFTNNAGVPLIIKPGPDGTVTVVTPPTYSGNGGGDAMVIDLGNPCEGKEEEKPVEEGKPVNVVEVPFKDGAPVQQDCATYSGTVLMLPDGTWVKFGCPFEGSVSLEGLLEEELPGSLGAGAEFVSAIMYGMTNTEGLEVLVNPDGTITLKFKIPEDSNARAYDILYWDPSANNGAGAWVTLPQYKFGQPQAVSLNPGDPEDGRLITRGVKQKGEYVTVTVNFTGTFVLVAR